MLLKPPVLLWPAIAILNNFKIVKSRSAKRSGCVGVTQAKGDQPWPGSMMRVRSAMGYNRYSGGGNSVYLFMAFASESEACCPERRRGSGFPRLGSNGHSGPGSDGPPFANRGRLMMAMASGFPAREDHPRRQLLVPVLGRLLWAFRYSPFNKEHQRI